MNPGATIWPVASIVVAAAESASAAARRDRDDPAVADADVGRASRRSGAIDDVRTQDHRVEIHGSSPHSARDSQSFQSVEQQIEPELELARVARLVVQMLPDVLGQMWQVRERQRLEGPAHVALLLRDREVRQDPEHEAGDVAVKRVVGVMSQLGREPGTHAGGRAPRSSSAGVPCSEAPVA